MASHEGTEWMRFFRFWHTEVRLENRQLRGDCPFPDCPNPHAHFYANPCTGQWDCKRCGRDGNAYDFLRLLHASWLTDTRPEDYMALCNEPDQRFGRAGLLPEVCEEWQLAYIRKHDIWTLPAWSQQHNKLVNLYSWRWLYDDKSGEHYRSILSSPIMRQLLYGVHRISMRGGRSKPLYLCEGHWDALAFHGILWGNGLLDDVDFVGVPGAKTFPDEYLTILSGRNVIWMGDNDDSGETGLTKLVEKIVQKGTIPASLSKVRWPEGLPQGFDIRDIVTGRCPDKFPGTDTWQGMFEAITGMTVNVPVDVKTASNEGFNSAIQPEVCATFEDLIDCYNDKFYMTSGIEDTLAAMLSVNLAVSLGSKGIWMYVIGPPSSGKTSLAECQSAAHPYCYALSKFTGIHSGMAGQDAGLLPHFQNRTVIIKDFTTVLNLPPAIQENIMGELRDIYDGYANVHYRNRTQRVHHGVKFNLIACVTDAIRAHNHTTLGERFLQCEIDSQWDEHGRLLRDETGQDDHCIRAIDNELASIASDDNDGDWLLPQKKLTWGFLQECHGRSADRAFVRKITESIASAHDLKRYISHLGRWVAIARAEVKRDKDKQLLYRPRLELGLRLSAQLTKLCVSLCILFNIPEPDERVWRIVRKVSLDTGNSFLMDIIMAIAHRGEANREQIASATGLHPTAVNYRMKDLLELGAVRSRPAKMGNSSRPQFSYVLSPETADLASSLGFLIPDATVD